MKAGNYSIFCLFTGSPSPLQEFSSEGELTRSVLTEEKIVEAYHFNRQSCYQRMENLHNRFWGNAIKVFDLGRTRIQKLAWKDELCVKKLTLIVPEIPAYKESLI